MSGASKRANGRASGPVLQSVFLAVIDHSVAEDLQGPASSCTNEEFSLLARAQEEVLTVQKSRL